jgi:2-dehydro-3-deoxygluconokinase
MSKRFVSIGECMLEMSDAGDGLYRLGYAGDTLNTAWYARALLGEDWSVDYVTALGEDIYSGQILDFLEANEIGTRHVQTIPARRPGLYLIHQDEGDRHFTYWRDTSAARLLADDREALFAAVEGAEVVYFSGVTLAILHPRARGRLLKALVRARDGGATLVFDTNIRPALWSGPRAMQAVLSAAASICDIVLPTHPDEAAIFGDHSPEDTARRYLELGVREVVVKNGSGAALAVADDDRGMAWPEPGADVVDATGAGDSFNGAYLAARLSGASLQDALVAAHRTARQVIGHKGALLPMAAFTA